LGQRKKGLGGFETIAVVKRVKRKGDGSAKKMWGNLGEKPKGT